MNSLFKSLNPQVQQQPKQPPLDIRDQYQQFLQNPIQFLHNNEVDIPQQFQNNPREAVQYLINSGQMKQPLLSKIFQMAQMMGLRL